MIDHEDDIDVGSFPNPVSSVLNINVDFVTEVNVRIIVFDVLGRRYLDKELHLEGDMLSLDVSSLVKGTYFYEIIMDKKCVLREKFIKN